MHVTKAYELKDAYLHDLHMGITLKLASCPGSFAPAYRPNVRGLVAARVGLELLEKTNLSPPTQIEL